jgi:hypothetical protein
VFAVQKVLQAGLPATPAALPPETEDAAPASGWRGLVERIGFGRGRA